LSTLEATCIGNGAERVVRLLLKGIVPFVWKGFVLWMREAMRDMIQTMVIIVSQLLQLDSTTSGELTYLC